MSFLNKGKSQINIVFRLLYLLLLLLLFMQSNLIFLLLLPIYHLGGS
jgi:hypothetical protein